MKKFILAAVVLVAMTAQTFAGPIITLTVEFGHKDDQGGCVERGICKITVSAGARSVTGNINDNTGNLDLSFNKSLMSRENVEYHFSNGIFEVPFDYTLSADLCSKLGVDTFTVKAGKYTVTEKNGILMISCVNKLSTAVIAK